jgi:hypothetical protein
MVFDQVAFQLLVPVLGGLENRLPLFAGAELAQMPEHAGDWAYHVATGR